MFTLGRDLQFLDGKFRQHPGWRDKNTDTDLQYNLQQTEATAKT